jgi:excisionase family DNA binding protein
MTEEPLLSLPEAAAYLNVHPRWLRRAVHREELRFIRLGRFLRFRRADLEALIEVNVGRKAESAKQRTERSDSPEKLARTSGTGVDTSSSEPQLETAAQ